MPRSNRINAEGAADAVKRATPKKVASTRRKPQAKPTGVVRSPGQAAARASRSPMAPSERHVPRLLGRYRTEALPSLVKEFGYTTPMAAPRLQRVVLNIGLGEAVQNPNAIEAASKDLGRIAGQHPVVTRARQANAGFKIRKGMPIGVMVTLRGDRMYEFLDKLVNAVLSRIRDFRGTPRTSFDGNGNYSLGLRDQVAFPEIDYNSIDRLRGLQIGIVTTARTDAEGLRLLELLGMPFARQSTSHRN